MSGLHPTALSDLGEALVAGDHELVALVGGGGKTTTLRALGDQLPGRVLLTTTTRVGVSETADLITFDDPDDDQIAGSWPGSGAVFVRRRADGHKSIGVGPRQCDRWFDLVDHVVVEADGARRRPYTAPRTHEPVVPSRTTTLVACIGADALGRVIADCCHSPLRVAAAAGCSPYQRLTPARAAEALLSERGSRKSCPPSARFVIAATKVDSSNLADVGELVAAVAGRAPVVAVARTETPTPPDGYPATS